MTTVIQRASPNFNARRMPVDCIVLHATASSNTKGDIEWCCTPKSATNTNPVSYHAIVDRNGAIYALVPTDRRAWHAGVSSFMGRPDCNSYSIGLSFANRNDGKEAYTDQQYEIAAVLIVGYMAKHPAITLDRITTHAEVARPLGRKTDPLGFDMPRLLSRIVALQQEPVE